MNCALLTVAIRYEHDVVLTRQRARQVAALAGFDRHDQVRIATAVSEIARNAFRYAKGAKAAFSLVPGPPTLLEVRMHDQGPGIPNLKQVLDGQYESSTGLGLGILGAKRLMDEFEIESSPAGTTVVCGKYLPKRAASPDPSLIAAQLASQAPHDPFEEIQRQNQELLATLDQVQRQKSELSQLNRELEDTNRGVVALYAELDERADYLRRASDLKSQFLSNMTHEFRTPLNSITSLSRLLLDRTDGDLTAEQEKQVRFIQKAVNGLSDLVDDLLDLAKVEAGKLSIRPTEFMVQDLFGALRGMLRPLLAHNSAVTLVFEDPGELGTIHTDESKVSQILRNLISNALKFTERGEVKVGATEVTPGWVEFVVTDTGIGIESADHDRIFQEFIQVEGEHQKGKRGTGLGLPLSRKLAELLGGTLAVDSKRGCGSKFVLDLPRVYTGPAEAQGWEEVIPELDPERLPVLFIEDNAETQFIYGKFLQGTRFQSVPARSLQQARWHLNRIRPVAVVLDVLLGQGNSWDFLTELKRNDSTREIPVLVITVVENQRKALALGADAFHAKPVTRDWLLSELERINPSREDEVLVVDDDEAARYVLGNVLRHSSTRVIEAASGAEALALARQRRPEAVFLDLMMPGMSGFEVLDALQADPVTRNIPVIIHTAKPLTQQDRTRLRGRVLTVLQKTRSDRESSSRMAKEALAEARRVTSSRKQEQRM